MNPLNNKTLKNVFWQYIYQFLNILIPLYTFKIVFERVELTTIGNIALATSMLMLTKVFVDFGFTIKGPVIFYRNKENIKKILLNIIYCRICAAILVFIVLVLINTITGYTIYSYLFLPCMYDLSPVNARPVLVPP